MRLRSNHYALTTVLPGARLHSVNITPTAGAAKQAPEGGVPLDVRAAVMGALATRADWDNQRWRFDPASCRLYTRDNLAAGEHDVTLAANAGNSSFKVCPCMCMLLRCAGRMQLKSIQFVAARGLMSTSMSTGGGLRKTGCSHHIMLVLLPAAQVCVSYGPGQPAQSRVVRALDVRPPTKYRFRPVGGGNETNVAAYWAATRPQLKLKHAGDWPCVMISKTAAIPLELVRCV